MMKRIREQMAAVAGLTAAAVLEVSATEVPLPVTQPESVLADLVEVVSEQLTRMVVGPAASSQG
jgi:hypothetical protein